MCVCVLWKLQDLNKITKSVNKKELNKMNTKKDND